MPPPCAPTRRLRKPIPAISSPAASQHQQQTKHHRNDKAHHLVARHRRRHATDRQIRARHQKTPHVSRKRDSVIWIPQIIRRNPNGKRQRQRQKQKQPRRQKFSNNRLPRGNRKSQQQFHRSHAPLFRPQTHPHRRH